jgi:hypothetical protein
VTFDEALKAVRALFDHEAQSKPAEPAADPNAAWFAAMEKANTQIRDTAKWLVTSFAAVGAILLGTIQLSTVGKLTNDSPHDRIVATEAGAAMALGGLILILYFTSSVLIPFVSSFRLADRHKSTAKKVLDDKEVLGYGYQELKDKWQEAADAADVAENAVSEAGDAVTPAQTADLTKMNAKFEEMRVRKRIALALVGSELLRDRFETARLVTVTGVLLAGIGLALFAWGSNPPATPEKPAVSLESAPVRLTVHLEPTAVTALAKPRGCSAADLTVLQIGGTPTAREVVSVPAGSCRAVRFVLTQALGTAVAAG